MRATPGMTLDLTAIPAPNAAAAAHYYPAIYWYTLMKIPPASEFGGKGAIPEKITQNDWLRQMNNVDCIGCHQLGQESTRTIPAALGHFNSGEDAWIRRTPAVHPGGQITNGLAGQCVGVPYKHIAYWSGRRVKGEVPKVHPTRPAGIVRDAVNTSWEWSTPDEYLHDLTSSDRRNPTVNAYGPLFGSPEYSTDNMPILDPKTNKVSFFKMPVRDPAMPVSLGPGHAGTVKPMADSAYWGSEVLWDTRANNHNSMFDKQGRVWLTATVRGMDNPAWCKKGSENEYAKAFPLDKACASRHARSQVDEILIRRYLLCHAPSAVGYDADNTLWFSGTGQVVGWVNTKVFDETGDAQKAQGWAPWVLDTTATASSTNSLIRTLRPIGKRSTRHGRLRSLFVMPNPKDGSIWYDRDLGGPPDSALRSKTKLSEVYIPKPGFGFAVTSTQRRAVGSGSSGHLMSFDRSKCKGPLNGPSATGNHCPEGWAFYKYPAPVSKASPTRARRRVITPGSTSTTRSGLARMFRSRPPISVMALSRSRTGRWSRCEFPTPWASMPKVSTDASTTRMQAGKAVVCGALTATARRG